MCTTIRNEKELLEFLDRRFPAPGRAGPTFKTISEQSGLLEIVFHGGESCPTLEYDGIKWLQSNVGKITSITGRGDRVVVTIQTTWLLDNEVARKREEIELLLLRKRQVEVAASEVV